LIDEIRSYWDTGISPIRSVSTSTSFAHAGQRALCLGHAESQQNAQKRKGRVPT
jgi:hypothetical protein